uniref:Uncharacterized protein n=1 Tax=Anopheles farauti TaxID=69004 RepID=A0A182R0E2_9DIPT
MLCCLCVSHPHSLGWKTLLGIVLYTPPDQSKRILRRERFRTLPSYTASGKSVKLQSSMGKGKGGGGGGGGGAQGSGALQVAVPPKVEMTLKVVLAVKQETREERRVGKSDGAFNPFPGQQPTPIYFRKR